MHFLHDLMAQALGRAPDREGRQLDLAPPTRRVRVAKPPDHVQHGHLLDLIECLRALDMQFQRQQLFVQVATGDARKGLTHHRVGVPVLARGQLTDARLQGRFRRNSRFVHRGVRTWRLTAIALFALRPNGRQEVGEGLVEQRVVALVRMLLHMPPQALGRHPPCRAVQVGEQLLCHPLCVRGIEVAQLQRLEGALHVEIARGGQRPGRVQDDRVDIRGVFAGLG